jgi:hypothetical protein
MRRPRPALACIAPPLVALAAVLAGGCGAAPAPSPTPVVVVVTATPAVAPTAPVATPTAGATATPAPAAGESSKPTAGTGESSKPAGGAGESLKPGGQASPTAALPPAPAATPAPARDDRLKPVEPTTAPAARTTAAAPPKSRFLVEALAKLQPTPTPVPTRKGVANPNVNPQQYATGVITDLVAMAESLERIQTLMAGIEQGSAAEADIVAGVQAETDILNGVYQRQVARDFPPALKRIDDLFAESTRYASFMMNSFTALLRTGDEKYVAEVESHAAKFATFFSQLMTELS